MSYKALYGRPCRTQMCWNEVDKQKLAGHELMQATTNKTNNLQIREFSTKLAKINDVFHVSMLRKYIFYLSHVFQV